MIVGPTCKMTSRADHVYGVVQRVLGGVELATTQTLPVWKNAWEEINTQVANRITVPINEEIDNE